MRFDLDDEQRAIKDAARELCQPRYTPQAPDDAGARTDAFWPELAASGWTQLAVPRCFGGSAGGVLELSLVVEELAYALAPGTYFANACAGMLLAAAAAGGEDDRLPGITSGERRAAFGVRQSDGRALALELEGASALVVAGEDRASVTADAAAQAQAAAVLDLTRRFSSVGIPDGAQPLHGDLHVALDCVEVLIAAELVGLAQHALELAVQYATQRQQFGRPIGAYQAVSHRCADMLVAVESARSATLAAAWTADHEPEALPFAASVAKVAAAHAGWSVTTSALQVHGGIGFTWEHPIHLFLRRAAVSARLLGSVERHLDRVAALSGLPAPS